MWALECDLGGGFDDCVSPGGGRASPGGRGSPRTGRVSRRSMSTNKIINMEFDVAPTLWCSSRDEEADSPPPQDVNGSSYTPVSRGKSKADVVHEQAHIIQTLQHELKELKSRMDDMEEVQTAAQHDAGDDDDDGEGRTRPIDRLYEKADESYYFRVQTMILYNAVTPRLVLHFAFLRSSWAPRLSQPHSLDSHSLIPLLSTLSPHCYTARRAPSSSRPRRRAAAARPCASP